MTDLQANGDIGHLPKRANHNLECRFRCVIPQAEIARSNTSRWLDGRTLNHQHAGTGLSETTQMHEVPSVRAARPSHKLSHRRHHNAVRQY